jgi:hypothetical protein
LFTIVSKNVAVLRARVLAVSAVWEIEAHESWQWGGLEEE